MLLCSVFRQKCPVFVHFFSFSYSISECFTNFNHPVRRINEENMKRNISFSLPLLTIFIG